MSGKLSRQDIQLLLSDESSANKIAVTKKIAAGYLDKHFDAAEVKLAEEIFRLVMRDAEVRVKATLAEALKESEQLPRDIAVSMAVDEDEVATPILEYSPVLTENDLLEIMSNDSMQKLIAISRRKNLTEKLYRKVSEALINSPQPNQEQIEEEKNFEKLVTDIANDRQAIKDLVSFISIPPSMTEKMIQTVASEMIAEVKQKYDLSPGILDRVAGHTIELSTLAIIDNNTSQQEIDNLVQHLSDFNRLTTSMIISALCTCKLRFFVTALAKRANIPVQNVELLIEKGGTEGIKKLMVKAEMPEKLHNALDVVLRFVVEKRANRENLSPREFCKELINKLEYYNDRSRIEYLNYLLAIAKQSLKTPSFQGF